MESQAKCLFLHVSHVYLSRKCVKIAQRNPKETVAHLVEREKKCVRKSFSVESVLTEARWQTENRR